MVKRIVVKVDEYEKDGQMKGKYTEVGVIMSNENGEYALLDPSVNLAGILMKANALAAKNGKPSRDMVAASIFDNSNQQQGGHQGWGQPQQPQQQIQQPQQQYQQQPQQGYQQPPQSFDDVKPPF